MEEQNKSPVEVLKEQILEKRNNAIQERKANEVHVREASDIGQEMDTGSQEEGDSTYQEKTPSKKIKFHKGDENWEIDEDAVLEFTADKNPMKMSLRELRNAAAGGIAVENRMRKLAEERKQVKTTFKDFTAFAKSDPLKALEFIADRAKEFDPDIDHISFLGSLADQLQAIGRMGPAEAKAWELERKNKDLEGRLTEHERSSKVIALRDDLIEETGMKDEHFDLLAQAVIDDPVIAKGIETEEDIIEKVGELYHEMALQKVAQDALMSVDPKLGRDESAIQELTLLLKLNKDFTQAELQEIARAAAGQVKRSAASQYLSNKKRTAVDNQDYIAQGMSPKDVLKQKILEKKQADYEQRYGPLQKRAASY